MRSEPTLWRALAWSTVQLPGAVKKAEMEAPRCVCNPTIRLVTPAPTNHEASSTTLVARPPTARCNTCWTRSCAANGDPAVAAYSHPSSHTPYSSHHGTERPLLSGSDSYNNLLIQQQQQKHSKAPVSAAPEHSMSRTPSDASSLVVSHPGGRTKLYEKRALLPPQQQQPHPPPMSFVKAMEMTEQMHAQQRHRQLQQQAHHQPPIAAATTTTTTTTITSNIVTTLQSAALPQSNKNHGGTYEITI